MKPIQVTLPQEYEKYDYNTEKQIYKFFVFASIAVGIAWCIVSL